MTMSALKHGNEEPETAPTEHTSTLHTSTCLQLTSPLPIHSQQPIAFDPDAIGSPA
jgi:hypothetical protein